MSEQGYLKVAILKFQRFLQSMLCFFEPLSWFLLSQFWVAGLEATRASPPVPKLQAVCCFGIGGNRRFVTWGGNDGLPLLADINGQNISKEPIVNRNLNVVVTNF